ncbi:MAG: cohesin domain-containing protein [Eubacteriales bacterium]|nr:cohesin domain-containing protein [Eubacteriales bacterium]
MKKILTLILSLIMIISVLSISQPVEAVSGSMTLRASTNTLYANQTLTVTVGLSAPVDVGSFDCILTFNSNLLRFNGGNSSIGAGINQAGNQIKIVKNAGSEVNTSTIASLSFSAVGSGDANFSVSDGIGASLALDYTFSGGASTSVKVEAGPAPTPAPTTTTTKPKQSPLTTIAPPTSKEETTTTTVTEETSETSTGTTRPLNAVDHKGRKLSVAEIGEGDLTIPSGFEADERVINGNKLAGYYSEEEGLFLASLKGTSGKAGLYFYNSSNKSFIPYLRFTLGEDHYHVTWLPDEQMPHGTVRTDAEVRGVSLPLIEFNSAEYISLDEYIRVYQERLVEAEGKLDNGNSGNSSYTVGTIDTEVERKNTGIYLLALEGKDKKLERFFYSQSLDQLLHYDLLLVPAFGTFLDDDFEQLVGEDLEELVEQTEATTEASTQTSETQPSIESVGGIVLFGRTFELWQIAAVAGGVLLLIILIVVIVIVRSRPRDRSEYPFANVQNDFDHDFEDNQNRDNQIGDSPNESNYLDTENFRPASYTYPEDFPEVKDISDMGAKESLEYSEDAFVEENDVRRADFDTQSSIWSDQRNEDEEEI